MVVFSDRTNQSRGEVGFEADLDMFSADPTENIEHVGGVDSYTLIDSFDIDMEKYIPSSYFGVSGIKFDFFVFDLEKHFGIEIVFSGDEADLLETLDEISSFDDGFCVVSLWKKIGVVWEVTVEES